MSQKTEDIVPFGTPDLCFDSTGFIKDYFSVDQFLQDHRDKEMETMRDDLGVYLKILRSALIDLINKDYADFVNLSSNLIGLDKAIKNIVTPLGQLKEELAGVSLSLDGAINEVNEQLLLRNELREKKRSLRSLSRLHTSVKKLKAILSNVDDKKSVDAIILERASSEYCQLQFHFQKCQHDISINDTRDFEHVGNLLVRSVDKYFLDSLSQRDNGKTELHQCLHFYHSLDQLEYAEKFYKENIVTPAMTKLSQDISQWPLPGRLPALYEKMLEFVDVKMQILLEVSKEFNQVFDENKCDFFLKSFWPEVLEHFLDMILNLIYAAGDPDLFVQRYTDTLGFLEQLYKRCESKMFLNQLQSHSKFISFMDSWGLPVYFQLRFQEIVRNVESGFAADTVMSKSDEWKLTSTETLWDSLNRCWEKNVYLMPVAHKFWKLSLQIISRFTSWIKMMTTNSKVDVHFLAFLYTDIETFIQKVPDFKNKAIEKLPSLSSQTIAMLKKSLEESMSELQKQLENVSNSIIRVLSGECTTVLRQVSGIPRLFRRTNRDAPSKHCPYITSLLEGPCTFYEKHKNNPKTIPWLEQIFSSVTRQYYSSVDDVLNSIQKTEESLRRFKKARDSRVSSNVVPNDSRVGDDNKIRHQLLLDVHAYTQAIEGLGLKRTSIDHLSELILLVEASQKGQ